ncbi:MAG: hypothetical protein CSA18_00845 [Deltaproteobacteria bacterium]|nr:MAG: hypothetical protein CSA18_00845 [Deltaproteobacteria bacterium]
MKVDEKNASSNTDIVPGSVYLCRYENLTCGACCGIYNFHFDSRKDFIEIITRRSLLFESVKRELDCVIKFGEKESEFISSLGKKPYPFFHHCPFVGFLDKNYKQTGCLLHPLAEKNNGVDFRGLSYYGGFACASYFCPTYHDVSMERKLVTRAAIKDFFDYGLLITENEMINNLFDCIEEITHKKTASEDYTPEALSKLESIFNLKKNWPFKKKEKFLANYFFKDMGNDQKQSPPIYENSKIYAILESFKVSISNEKDLLTAENFIFERIQDLCLSLQI